MEDLLTRILIVDDNETIHDDFIKIIDQEVSHVSMEEQLLRAELFGTEVKEDHSNNPQIKYKIDHAYQGNDAVNMIDQAEMEGYPYALIYMDVRMPPGMNGVEAIQQIWKMHPEVEVVLCTAYSDYTWEKILDKFGTTDHLLFIKKPFDSVSIKQITLSLTTKWKLAKVNKNNVENLEQEVSRRTEELNELVNQLSKEVALRKENEKQLSILANFDILTGLANRFFFNQAIKDLVEGNSNENDSEFALFFIDIDYFKQVNDLMGHDVGDELLKLISERLIQCLEKDILKFEYLQASNERKSTAGIFRLGGDEFTALVNFKNISQIKKLAESTVNRVKKHYMINNQKVAISCSIGISIYPQDAKNTVDLIKFADIAMYRAKEEKGTSILFDKKTDTNFIAQLALQDELTKALLNEQIILNYQALFDKNNGVIGMQALARWDHPIRGILPPLEFISIAEKSHQNIEIGKYILQTACLHLKELHRHGFNDQFLFVNCTNKQFYDRSFIGIVKAALSNSDLEPRFLKLGIEEKFSLKDPKLSLTIINELTQMGISFAIDGFGQEESLLDFLQKVPKDSYIKIDRNYVKKLEEDPTNVNFLYSMLDLIQSRQLKAIVSGIETEKQKEIVIQKDCIIQGFYFNKPKTFDLFLTDFQKLKENKVKPFD